MADWSLGTHGAQPRENISEGRPPPLNGTGQRGVTIGGAGINTLPVETRLHRAQVVCIPCIVGCRADMGDVLLPSATGPWWWT
jgi:hypothetical protein